MKACKKQFIYISILLLIMLLSLCGCANKKPVVDEAYIEAELQERYGIEFVCDSLKYSQNMYIAICHPLEDTSLNFSCMYSSDGSLGYDYYVGAIIAREEKDRFTGYIGDGLGDSIISCAYALIIDEGVPGYIDSNLAICELIKEDSFSIKKAYEICPIDHLFFWIYINDQYYSDDFEKEYETIECAVDKLVSQYKELYDLEIYVSMEIYYLNDEDYKKINAFYEGDFENIDEILDYTPMLSLEMGYPKEYVTEDLWLSKEEYISEREDMK